MLGNQKTHGFSLAGPEPQPGEDLLDRGETALDVVRTGHALANVVEKQAQEQELRLLELGEQFRELRLPSRVAPRPMPARRGRPARRHRPSADWAKASEVFDCAERMLVHRVAVIEVAEHQRVHSVKLWEKCVQESEAVHRAQGPRGFRRG